MVVGSPLPELFGYIPCRRGEKVVENRRCEEVAEEEVITALPATAFGGPASLCRRWLVHVVMREGWSWALRAGRGCSLAHLCLFSLPRSRVTPWPLRRGAHTFGTERSEALRKFSARRGARREINLAAAFFLPVLTECIISLRRVLGRTLGDTPSILAGLLRDTTRVFLW